MHKVNFLARHKKYGKWKEFKLITDKLSSGDLYEAMRSHVQKNHPESKNDTIEISNIRILKQ